MGRDGRPTDGGRRVLRRMLEVLGHVRTNRRDMVRARAIYVWAGWKAEPFVSNRVRTIRRAGSVGGT